MPSSYKRLGDYISEIKDKNVNLEVHELLGINIDKFFMPSVANTIGTDMTNYKVVKKNQFACNRMHVGRDYRLPIALSDKENPFLVSPAYDVFEIGNTDLLMPEYLMLWFKRSEFDRNAWFYTDADVRGGLSWSALLDMKLPIPSIEKQRAIVKEYNTIEQRINLNNQLIQKLEDTAQNIFHSYLDKNRNGEKIRLGDLIDLKGGFSYNSYDLGTGNSYLLGMGCVSFSNRFVEDGMRLYSDYIPEHHLVKSKDIIIATRQQSENMPILGCPAMIPPNMDIKKLIVASNLYRVVNKSNLNNEIIYQILRNRNYQEHIKLQMKGTTVGMITKDAIEDYFFEASLPLLHNLQKKIIPFSNIVFLKMAEKKLLKDLNSLFLSRLAKES